MSKHSRGFVTDELIHQAEVELGVELPNELKAIWLVHNCNELSGGWRFYPIFDPSNPRKTASSIAHENLRGAWGQHIRSLGLIALASNQTGNHLVARVVDGRVEPKIFHWHHETERVTHWKPGISSVMQSAQGFANLIAEIAARFENKA